MSRKKLEEEAVTNAVAIDFKGVTIPVISHEYLIIMKLKSGGPRDLLDVQELLQVRKELDTEHIKNLAKRFRVDRRPMKIKIQK